MTAGEDILLVNFRSPASGRLYKLFMMFVLLFFEYGLVLKTVNKMKRRSSPLTSTACLWIYLLERVYGIVSGSKR